jgi:hypothetical protein
MIDIPAILNRKYPGCEWTLNGDDYDGLEWLDKSPKPSQNEIETAWSEVLHEIEIEQVQRARGIAYSETADPLFFKVQRGEATEAEWLAAVEAVRQAHPYPAV